MQLLIFPVLAFAPGIFWLWFFLRRDIYQPAPRRLVALTFFLGMVSTIPAALIEAVFLGGSHAFLEQADPSTLAAAMLFVVGPVEETCKFLAVRLVPFRSLYFDEPIDGLVYAAAASLGFASLENLIYVIQFGPEVMIGRAPISTVAHVVFGGFWGFALGKQVQGVSRRSWLGPVAGVAAAAIVHGFFNIVVFSFWPAGLVLVGLGLWWVLGRFRWAQRVSPFRYRRNYPEVVCFNCRRRIRIISRYCQFCGYPSRQPYQEIYCGFCGKGNRMDAGYCTQCGDRLLR